jgi:hypothetical protein
MASSAEARKYPHISWRPITHLFWGRFAFKVETHYPARGFRPMPPSYTLVRKTSLVQMISVDRQRFQRVVASFRKACLRHTPDDRSRWRSLETETSFHYYFIERADMLRFVAGNVNKITTVYEPAHETDVVRLIDTKNTYLRATLFFDAYPYRVLFRRMPEAVVNELDTWVPSLFPDHKQAKYNSFGKRCLYLSNENDILLTRLAFSQYISRVEHVILRSDPFNASIVGETSGGEGSDPAVHGV